MLRADTGKKKRSERIIPGRDSVRFKKQNSPILARLREWIHLQNIPSFEAIIHQNITIHIISSDISQSTYI